MPQGVLGGKKTILFIRSSPLHHSLELLKRLRARHHADSETRWIVIVQPQLEREFAEALEGVETAIWRYDRGQFTRRSLNDLFLESIRRAGIDAAYVPFNNPDGIGYFQILRFLSGARIPEIFIHISGEGVERITLNGYMLRRAKDILPDMIETLIFILVLPFALLFTAMQSWRGQRGSSI